MALLARNNPKWVLVTGLFYGYLRTGAQIMERSSDVTREVVLIIQAIIILLITAEQLCCQRWWRGGIGDCRAKRTSGDGRVRSVINVD